MKLFEFKKNDTLILKGIAILFVLLDHLEYYLLSGGGGVALFLLLSGYGINQSCENKGMDFFWRKRIINVWLPYVLIGIFDVVVFRVEGVRSVLCTLIGLDFDLIADKTMWYISFILSWYILYYIMAMCSKLARNPKVRRGVLIIGLFAVAPVFYWLYNKGVWHFSSRMNCCVWFFPLGVLMSCLKDIKVNEKLAKLLWFAVLMASSAFILRNYTSGASTARAFAISAQPIAALRLVNLNGKVSSLLSWLGRYSYPIYLVEGIFWQTRNGLFWKLEMQAFIDIAFVAVVLLNAVVFWEAYQKTISRYMLDKIP